MVKVTHFMRRPRDGYFSLERLYEDVRAAMPGDCSVRVHVCRNFSNGVWPRLQNMWLARGDRGEVNHVTGDVHFLAIALPRAGTVLTIADLVLLKRMRGPRLWLVWLIWYSWPIARASAIITISQETRRDLLNWVKCDPAKVHVIYCPVSSEFQYRPREFNETCPRVLLIGTSWNKNVETIARAVVGIPCLLTIIGQLSCAQFDLLRELGIQYENYTNLSRQEIVEEYDKADLLLFASTFEGFGLPIVEAQATGRPVITSDLQPMKEVAGGAACLVDPFDCASIREGVKRVIGDSSYRTHLVECGLLNSKRFGRDEIASQYADIYRQVSIETHKRRVKVP